MAEWKMAAFGAPEGGLRLYPWGDGRTSANINLAEYGPGGRPLDPWKKIVPSPLFDTSDQSAWGVVGMGGNVSEWVTSKPGATRQVVLGGSWQDSMDRASRAYRSVAQSVRVRKGTIGFRCALALPEKWDDLEE